MRARIRTLKPEMWADEKINNLSRDARLLLLGLITMADDEGRFRARQSAIIGHVFPADEDARELIRGWIAEIGEQGIVVFYLVDGAPYGAFRHWRRHQKINRASASQLPPPPERKVVRENVSKPYDSNGNFKKTSIPDRVRRAVARACGAKPGEETVAHCHWCDSEGSVVWTTLPDGRPGSWVSFDGLELDHVIPEVDGGATDETNIVLACRSCNRRRGHLNGDRHPDSRDSVSSDHGTQTHSVIRDHGSNTESSARRRALRSDPILLVVPELCQRLAKRMLENDPRSNPQPDSERWLDDMRLLVKDRGWSLEAVGEVERMIDWCQSDAFWRSNILSSGKLRKQFTQMLLRSQKPAGVNGGGKESPSDIWNAMSGGKAA